LRASQEIQESISVRDGDPKELLERAQQRVFEVAQEGQSGELVPIGEILHEELEKLEKQSQDGSALTGTPTGFRDLDELTGGLQPGNLIIVAARPSMGKSALVTNIAENAALAGFPVALFSLEMSKTELAQRFISSQAKIDGDALRKGKIKKDRWPAVMEAADTLSKAPLWIDDSSDINILELRAKARRLHGKSMGKDGKGLGLIIVDYLQLLRASDGRDSRVEQVAQMSRGLKILARELSVPVIAVSQLSRAVESRTPPKPQLSDLRESGQIEQDADLVSFIYREEYYMREESERPGVADIIVAKHRNGPVKDVELTFLSHYPKFSNMPRGARGEEMTGSPDRVPAARVSDGYNDDDEPQF
jgi:replicative DNA helicase